MTTRQQQIKTAQWRKRWQWTADYGWCIVVALALIIALAWVSPTDAERLGILALWAGITGTMVWRVSVWRLDQIGHPTMIAKVVNGHTVELATATGMFVQEDIGKEIHFVSMPPERQYPLPSCTEVDRVFIDYEMQGWLK